MSWGSHDRTACLISQGCSHRDKQKNKILFILWTSKTHTRASKPQMIKITSHTATATALNANSSRHLIGKPTITNYCPFNILKNYVAVRPSGVLQTEQFFVFADRSRVSPTHFRSTLKLMLNRLNINAKPYNLHSFRIGRCGDLYKYGVTVETIKKIGRWKSNAIFSYFCN